MLKKLCIAITLALAYDSLVCSRAAARRCTGAGARVGVGTQRCCMPSCTSETGLDPAVASDVASLSCWKTCSTRCCATTTWRVPSNCSPIPERDADRGRWRPRYTFHRAGMYFTPDPAFKGVRGR
jgi:hypothetical protein